MSHGYRRSASSIHSQQDSPHQSRPVSSHSIVPPNIPMAEQTNDSVTQLLAGLKLDTTSHSKKLSSQTKTIKEALITSAGCFADKKQKIMWIASFFHNKGTNGEGCPLHNWWRGLLRKNVAAQGLPTVNASSHADYGIDELKSAQFFITALKATFTNH
ncbi:hypothetical protein PCANC_22191 [Puccinia coronata f. sp. avenae]|uniref:Uncharacterized protein n=1 Tax=Puccinia coronata f. sp. avenae TaxID=200324 RepID=A0A2N5S699_9BASI|nr:hypothetical protein PCANC_22191 [Puccinia coronata f. sp. avenae]